MRELLSEKGRESKRRRVGGRERRKWGERGELVSERGRES